MFNLKSFFPWPAALNFIGEQATSDLGIPQQILNACRLCFHLGEEEDGGGEAAAA